jgi:hypothetical protein
MTKRRLLENHLELIKEIAGEVYSECIQGSGTIKSFNKIFDSYTANATKKEYLFTTDDGIDIYVGDTIWRVYTEDTWVQFNENGAGQLDAYKVYVIDNIQPFEDYDNWNRNVKIFSTLEKAKDFIFYNKPCLCLNDIVKLVENKLS